MSRPPGRPYSAWPRREVLPCIRSVGRVGERPWHAAGGSDLEGAVTPGTRPWTVRPWLRPARPASANRRADTTTVAAPRPHVIGGRHAFTSACRRSRHRYGRCVGHRTVPDDGPSIGGCRVGCRPSVCSTGSGSKARAAWSVAGQTLAAQERHGRGGHVDRTGRSGVGTPRPTSSIQSPPRGRSCPVRPTPGPRPTTVPSGRGEPQTCCSAAAPKRERRR